MSPSALLLALHNQDAPLVWENLAKIGTQNWRCGHCDREVASDSGWDLVKVINNSRQRPVVGAVAICPNCKMPSFLSDSVQVPSPPYGVQVDHHLPNDVARLYEEARRAMSASAPSAASMAARKLLAHVAAELGAEDDKSFAYYVGWLIDNGHVTPGMKNWVDEIRELGNDATHEIRLVSQAEANEIMQFAEMLLRIIYEYPARGKQSSADRKARDTQTGHRRGSLSLAGSRAGVPA